MEENKDLEQESSSTPQPMTKADEIKQTWLSPDFTPTKVMTDKDLLSTSVMQMSDAEREDLLRSTGVYASTGQQVSTAIENALTGMNQLGDELMISFGNVSNYITGGAMGKELQDIAYDSMARRYEYMAMNEDAVGGIRSELAQLAGGATSFLQLALEGLATGGYLSLAHIGAQSFGEGTYNDMKAYADKHDGSLEGYKPQGVDLAINTANAIMQVATEEILGVGRVGFIKSAALRGGIKEGLGGFVQEAAQGALADLAEAMKGNEEYSVLLDNIDQYVRDGIIGGVLQGPLGAASYHHYHAKATNTLSGAIAKARGHETPTAEDQQQAEDIISANERGYASAFVKEFKAAFDASTGEGQLQANIAKAINDAIKAKELDLGIDDETKRAQKVEQIATQETLNAMEQANEQGKSISEMGINNIVYKDGAIWVEGMTPELGERAVEYARVLAERQTGLAEVQMKLDATNREVAQLQKEIAEAKVQSKEALVEKLKARLAKQTKLAEKRKVQAEQLKSQTDKIEAQIAKQLKEAPKTVAEPKKEVKSPAENVQKPVETRQENVQKPVEQPKPAEEPKPLAKVAEHTKKYKGEKKSLKQEREAQKKAKAKKETPAVEDTELLHQGEEMQSSNVAPQIKEQFDLADENARLDDIYPAYDGETIEVDGKERTVYNSNGDRIAKSKEALTNFWRWFGDSKVVDEQGRPLVVYHGSETEGIEEFDNTKNTTKQRQIGAEEGYFFTDSQKVAERFRTAAQRKAEAQYYKEGTTVEHVEEPVYDKQGREVGRTHYAKTTLPAYKDFGLYPMYLRMENISEYDGEVIGTGEDRRTMLRSAKANGKDGVIIYNADTGAGIATEYIVFDSNNIKSPKNEGTFSLDTNKFMKQSKVEGTGSDKYRGGYDEKLKRIVLSDKSDLTTIQHEFAHYWLQNNFKWARSGLASPEWLRKWRDVEEALGIEPQDRFLSKQASEKFARAYERFIMEGKYNEDLKWAFDGFKEFYDETYEDLKNEYFDLSEELDPAIVDWFNRQRPTTEKALKEQAYKKVATVAMAQGAEIVDKVDDNTYTVSSMNKNGEIETEVFVSDNTTKDSKLVEYSGKKKERRMVKGLQEINKDINPDMYKAVNNAGTVENARNWVESDYNGAWQALNDGNTALIDRTALYQAFKSYAEDGHPEVAVDLAQIKLTKEMTELGQAMSILSERSEFDPMNIIDMAQKALGEPSAADTEEETADMHIEQEQNVMTEAQANELKNQTECKL